MLIQQGAAVALAATLCAIKPDSINKLWPEVNTKWHKLFQCRLFELEDRGGNTEKSEYEWSDMYCIVLTSETPVTPVPTHHD